MIANVARAVKHDTGSDPDRGSRPPAKVTTEPGIKFVEEQLVWPPKTDEAKARELRRYFLRYYDIKRILLDVECQKLRDKVAKRDEKAKGARKRMYLLWVPIALVGLLLTFTPSVAMGAIVMSVAVARIIYLLSLTDRSSFIHLDEVHPTPAQIEALYDEVFDHEIRALWTGRRQGWNTGEERRRVQLSRSVGSRRRVHRRAPGKRW